MLGIAVLAAPGQAQEPARAGEEGTSAGEGAPVELEKVLVTGERENAAAFKADSAASATKSDLLLLETPQSVSVVTREFMDALQVYSATEALRYTAGVSPGAFGRLDFGDNANVRGFSSTYSSFVDGLRSQSFNIGDVQETYGLERIEFIKGAAAAVYGQSSPGGIFSYTSRRPQAQPAGEVQLGGGSLDLKRAAVHSTGALDARKKWRYGFTGLLRDQDDVQDFAYNDRLYLAPALSWVPSEAMEVTLLATFIDDDFRRAPELPSVGTVLPNPNGRIPMERYTGEPGQPPSEVQTSDVKLLATHRVSPALTLHHVLGWRSYDVFSALQNTTGLSADQRSVNRNALLSDIESEQLATDNRLQWTVDHRGWSQALLAGVDYYDIDDSSARPATTLAPLDLFTPVYGSEPVFTGGLAADSETRIEQVGVYLQDQIKWGPHWVLVAGVRHDQYEERTVNRLSGSESASDGSATTGRLGLLYRFDAGLAPYAVISRSFQPQAGLDFDGNGFDASEGELLEAGLKYEAPDGRWTLSSALFDITQTNLLTPDPVNSGFSVQTGEQRHRGAELESSLLLTPAWSLLLAYTSLDAEVTRSNIPGRVGKRPVNVPANAGSLFNHYRLGSGPLAGLSLGLGLGLGLGLRPAATTRCATAIRCWRSQRSPTVGVNADSAVPAKRSVPGDRFNTSISPPRAPAPASRIPFDASAPKSNLS